MNSLVVMALSNAVVAALMAVPVIAISRVCRRPALSHGLWLLVLLKLITPPVFKIQMPVESWWSEPKRTPPIVAGNYDSNPTRRSADRTESIRTGVAEAPLPVAGVDFPLPVKNPAAANPFAVKSEWSSSSQATKVELLADGQPVVRVEMPRNGAGIRVAEPVGNRGDVESGSMPLPRVAPDNRKTVPGARTASGTPNPFLFTNPKSAESVVASSTTASFDWSGAFPVSVAVWLAGSLFFGLLSVLRIIYFRQLIQRSQPAPIYLQIQTRELAQRLAMSQTPEVRLLPGAISPMLWAGGRVPLLLFPRELLGRMDDDSRSTLLLHELAHLQRGDHWVRYLELLTFWLYWWNPIVWLARRGIHRAEEECCDALVVENSSDGGRLYATALLDTLDFLADVRPAASPIACGIGHVAFIRHRLKMILAGSVSGKLTTPGRLGVLTLAVVLLPLLPTFAQNSAETAKNPQPTKQTAKPKVSSTAPVSTAQAKPKTRALAPNIGMGEPTDFEPRSTALQFESQEVRSLDITKNGRWMVSGHGRWTTEGRVRVWDLKTKKEIATFQEPTGIASVVFSPDGKLMASAGWDRVLRIRAMPSLKELHAIQLDSVARLAFSPDGQTLASATESQKLQFWNPKTGEEKPGLKGTFFRMQFVAYSRDGRYLAVGGGKFRSSRNGRVAVWDLKTGKQSKVITNLTAPMLSVAFSPNGKTVIAGGNDSRVHAWSVPDLKSVMTIAGHRGSVESVRFSPDGKTIVSTSSDNTIRIWDAFSGESLGTLSGHTSGVLAAVFSKDGKTLYSGGSDKMIRVWDPTTYRQTSTLQPGADALEIPEPVLSVAASPDGLLFASAHEDKSVRLRNATTGEVVSTLRGHADAVSHIAFSPDGKLLSTASFDKTVKLWKVSDGSELFTLKGHTNWVFSAAFSPDGNTLATSAYDKTIRLWYARTGKPIATLEGHAATVRTVAFSPDGTRLVSGSGDRTVKIWDVKKRKELLTLKGHKGTVREVAYAPDGQSIASASEDKTVKIWNAGDGTLQRTLTGHTGMVWALAYSPQGRTLATGGFDNSIIIWDPRTGSRRRTLRGHADVVTSLAFTPKMRGLISGSYDKSIRFWKAKQPALRELLTVSVSPQGMRAVEFSPDGGLLAAAGHDKLLRVWDTRTGKLRHVLRGHSGGIRTVAFSPDGRLLATGSWDHTIQIWSMKTGRSVAQLGVGSQHNVMSVKFTPDGKKLFSGGYDGTVRIWNVESGTLLKTFKKQALPIVAIDISRDGRFLLVSTGDYKRPTVPGHIQLWEVMTSKLVFDHTGNSNYRWARFSADGKHFATAGGESGAPLRVREVPTGKITSTPFRTGYSSRFAFLKDGQTMVATRGRSIILLNWRTGREIASYTGHEKSIYQVTPSPDGSLIASVSQDGTMKLWPTRRAPVMKSLLTIEATLKNATRFAIPTPDGNRLITGGHDKLVKIWDRKTGKLLKRLSGHQGGITCGAISADGRLLVTGSWDKTARIWDLESMKPTGTVLQHRAEVLKVRFRRDGRQVVTAGRTKRIQMWDLKTSKVVGQTKEQEKPVVTFDISPDGKFIAGSVSDSKKPREPARIQLWTFPGLKDVATLLRHRSELKSVRFSKDGRKVVIGGTDLLTVVDVRSRTPVTTLPTNTGIMGAGFMNDDRLVVSGDWRGAIRVWNARSGQQVAAGAEHDRFVFDLGFDPKTSQILSCGTDGTVRIWRLPKSDASLAERVRNWSAARAIPTVTNNGTRLLVDRSEQIYFGVVSPDFEVFAAGGENGVITLYNADGMAFRRKLSGHKGKVWSAAFSPDSKWLASVGNDMTLRIWNVATGKLHKSAKGHESRIHSVAFTPDGTQIVTVDGLGYIRIWDAKTGRSVAVFRKRQSGLTTLAVSPNGKFLAVGGWSKSVDLWRLADRRLLRSLTGHQSRITSLAFSPDSRTLVSGDISPNAGNGLKVWDVATRTLKYSVKENLKAILATAFSRDGKTLVTSGGDTNLRFRDLQTGRSLLTVPTNQGSDVRSITWSSERGRLITTGLRGTAKAWNVRNNGRMWMPGYTMVRPSSGTFALERIVARYAKGAWFAAYSPDGKLLATGGVDKTVHVRDTHTWQLSIPPVLHKSAVLCAAFSPDGKIIATSTSGGKVFLTSLETGKRLHVLSGHTRIVRKVAFTRDGKRVISAGSDKTVRIWDVATGKLLNTLDIGNRVWAASVSPDGKTVAVGTGDWTAKELGGVSIWNLNTGKQVKTLTEAKGHITSITHLSNTKLVIARGGVGVGVWNVETGKRISVLHWPLDVRLVRASKDRKFVVVAHGDKNNGRVIVYNLKTGAPSSSFYVSNTYLFWAEFSPDGSRIATASKDGTVKLWRTISPVSQKSKQTTDSTEARKS